MVTVIIEFTSGMDRVERIRLDRLDEVSFEVVEARGQTVEILGLVGDADYHESWPWVKTILVVVD